MLIAHLPAGFLVTKALIKILPSDNPVDTKHLLVFGLVFSVIPDIDLLYFFFVDSSAHHHKLFPHLPIFWLGVFLTVFAAALITKSKVIYYVVLICSINILTHLILDTFVGFVWWLYPLIDNPYYLVLVPNHFSHWIINFVLHWSFLVELLIVLTAVYVYAKRPDKHQN